MRFKGLSALHGVAGGPATLRFQTGRRGHATCPSLCVPPQAHRVELLGPAHPHPAVLHYPDHGHGGFLADRAAQVAVLAAALGRTEEQVAGAIAEAAARAKAASRGSAGAPAEGAAGMVLEGGRWGARGWRFRRGAKVTTTRAGAEDGAGGGGGVGLRQQQQRAWFARMWRGGRQVPGRHAHVLDCEECVDDGGGVAAAGTAGPWAEGMQYGLLEEERSIATEEPVLAGGYKEASSLGAGVTAADAAARGEEAPGTVPAAAGAGEGVGIVGNCGAPSGTPAGARAPGVADAQVTRAVVPNPPATTAVQLLGVLRALRRVPLEGMQPFRQKQQQEDAEAGRGRGPEAVGVGVGAAEGGAALRGQSWPAQVASMRGKGGGLTVRGGEAASPPAGKAEVGKEEEEPLLRAGWSTCGHGDSGGEVAAGAAPGAYWYTGSGGSMSEGVRAAAGSSGPSCPAPSAGHGRSPPAGPPAALRIPSSSTCSPVGTDGRPLGGSPLASPTRGGQRSVVPYGSGSARGSRSCPCSPGVAHRTAAAAAGGCALGGRAAVPLAGGGARVQRCASALGPRVAAVAAAAAAGGGGGSAVGGRVVRSHGVAVVPVGGPGVLFV